MVGAAGARQVYRRLGDLVEPFRDELVRRVVAGALRSATAGRPDDGAVSRLTRQVEIVRDTYAGLIVVVRGFVVTVIGVAVGLASLAPALLAEASPTRAVRAGWPLLLYLGVGPTAIAYALFTAGLGRVPATAAGIVSLLEPLTATTLGLLLFGERLGAAGLLGAMLLLAALVILARGRVHHEEDVAT